MKDTYQSLIQDAIAFAKESSSLFYMDSFSLENKQNPSKTSIEPIKKIVSPEKNRSIPPQPKEKAQVKKTVPPKRISLATKEHIEKPSFIPDSFQDVWQVVEKMHPSLHLCKNYPDDKIANEIAEKWKYANKAAPIMLVHNSEKKEEISFLQNVAKALQIYFYPDEIAPAKMVSAHTWEEKNTWNDFFDQSEIQMILIGQDILDRSTHLKAHYREDEKTAKKYLSHIPLMILQPLSSYITNPLQKKSLWKDLCQMMQINL